MYDLGAAGKTLADHRLYNGKLVDRNTARAGFVASSPNYYSTEVKRELKKIVRQVHEAPIHFQVGIPAAASAHEFAYSESPAYEGGKVDDRYALNSNPATGSPIYPDCATSDAVLAVNNKGAHTSFCAIDQASSNTYQGNIVADALVAIDRYKTNQDFLKSYIGFNLWAFNPTNSAPVQGQVVANNHWIPRATRNDDSTLAFPNSGENIPTGPDGKLDTDQSKYVLCSASGISAADSANYIIASTSVGCSNTKAGASKTPQKFDDGSYSHTPDEMVGMRLYYPNSVGIPASLAVGSAASSAASSDLTNERTEESNVFEALSKDTWLMSTTATPPSHK